MATFKIVSRTLKEYNPVYIRISHKSAADYIRTEITVHKSGLNKKKEVSDHFIMAHCLTRIREYTLKLNTINSEPMSVGEIKKFLLENKEGVSFTDFAQKYIDRLYNDNSTKAVSLYKTSLNSLKAF